MWYNQYNERGKAENKNNNVNTSCIVRVLEGYIMFKFDDFKKNSYRMGEVAELLGITPQTLRKYADDGILKTWRGSDKGNRRVHRGDLIEFVKTLGLYDDDDEVKRVNVLYFTNEVSITTQCKIVMKHLNTIKDYVLIHNSDYRISKKALTDILDSGVVKCVYLCSVDIPIIEYNTVTALCELYNTKLIEIK